MPIETDGRFSSPYAVGHHHQCCCDEEGINYVDYTASESGCNGKKPPTAAAANVELIVESPTKKACKSSEQQKVMRDVSVVAKKLAKKLSTENLATVPEEIWDKV